MPTSPNCPSPVGVHLLGCHLLGAHQGLVRPVRGGLAVVQHPGGRLLRRRLEGSAGARPARGLQCRLGKPIHRPRVHPGPLGTPDEDQHGREGPPAGITFVWRLCRTLKYDELYLKANATEAPKELGVYLRFYSDQRLHQALGYSTPAEVFYDDSPLRNERSKGRRCSPNPVLESSAGATGLSLYSAPLVGLSKNPRRLGRQDFEEVLRRTAQS